MKGNATSGVATSRPSLSTVALIANLIAAGAGLIARLAGAAALADAFWLAACIASLAMAIWWMTAELRRGEFGVDVISVLALVAAIATRELLAGAVIGVMLASGRVLEGWAQGRARRTLNGLLERAPTRARRIRDEQMEDIDVGELIAGDVVMVAVGDIVPVDGIVIDGTSSVDESTLTGEPLPVSCGPGDMVRSGTTNLGGPFRLRASADAEGSAYAGIVELVASASSGRTRFTRLADRWALAFVAFSLVLAGLAWLMSGDPRRMVAVLVVATPCPLILAAPVAIVAGLSRCAERGVVIKGGDALEQLGRVETVVFDKTGTLTQGRPEVLEILTCGGRDATEVLRLAASVDQASGHVLGAALVRAATDRQIRIATPTDVHEVPGECADGWVDGQHVAVGKASILTERHDQWVRSVHRRSAMDGAAEVFVAVDDEPVGAVLFDDPLRSDAPVTVRLLRRAGVRRVVVLSGDRLVAVEAVSAVLGVDLILADRSPAEKLEAIRLERDRATTLMVGDGINDAPALATADVGIAIGARGATASSDAADIVLVVDRLDRIADALFIARRTERIATQSVLAGIGLSVVAMVIAATGHLAPVSGAILQEAIDVAVILNALRALRSPSIRPSLSPEGDLLAARFLAEHRTLRPMVDRLRSVADGLDVERGNDVLVSLREVAESLNDDIGPHEQAEGDELYPEMARVLGGEDPTGSMARAHVEIGHLIRRYSSLVEDLGDGAPTAEDIVELRQLLYGLHAVLRLHNDQEAERYSSLIDVETS